MQVSSSNLPIKDIFELVCDNMNIGCWVADMQTNSTWWSDSYYHLLGIDKCTPVPVFETFVTDIVHPEDREKILASFEEALNPAVTLKKYEVRFRHANGHYNWYETYCKSKRNMPGNIEYVFGSIVNIDNKMRRRHESEKLKLLIDIAEDMNGIGVWERSFVTGKKYWSSVVYDIFELSPNDDWSIEDSINFVDIAQRKQAEEAIEKLKTGRQPFELKVQLTTVKGNQHWIRLMAKPVIGEMGTVTGMRGILQRIDMQKSKETVLIDINNKIAERNFFLDETSKMARVGGWEVNLATNNVIWSEQTKRIYEVYNDYKPSLENAISFFYGSSRDTIIEKFNRLITAGEPYDVELEFLTARKRKIWVRTSGKPVFDSNGNVVAVRGIFQDIDEQKRRELALKSSLSVINKQNNKLQDFAHIVSHNLRSHTGNLKMIASMIDLEQEVDMKLEWMSHIKDLSHSLDETVVNLTDIVNSHISIQNDKKHLQFSEVYQHVTSVLTLKNNNGAVQLNVDFSECEEIEYVPAYLESIMLNLMTNAIKYRHPKREAVIEVKTFYEDSHVCLSVSDNGLGIDLSKHGNRLFKMNQTFHNNADARGIGLYITKNQIENLGGTISVQSEVNRGTTFKVTF